MFRRAIPPVVLFVIFALGNGCRAVDPPKKTVPELPATVASAPSTVKGADKDIAAAVQRFYEGRQNNLAWTTEAGPTEIASQALDVLRAAESHGFARRDYQEPELTQLHAQLAQANEKAPNSGQQIAEFDVRLTTNLLLLGRHVAVGRIKPTSVDSLWESRREAPDLVPALQQAADGNMPSFLDAVRPPHQEYKALQDAMVSLQSQATKGWPKIPRATLKVGQWNQAVIPLRQRLATSGYLPATAATDSAQYDAEVEEAVRAFQAAHSLKETGNLDPATVAALNVPLEWRIQQVAMNLERWRWMANDLGARHFMVNVPYYHLIARENGKPVLDIRVVVGKRGDETPIFSDSMETVVFSPYWNIPDSILQGETIPAMARDPNYLARNNMEIIRRDGRMSIRQRPGANNALGYVKFLFPNKHNVYLHDTPADSLFRRMGRAFSHGCVRVEEPEVLAQYVLRDQAKWTPGAIQAAMRSGNEQHVKLPEPIPVHIVYFTAWVDENGGLHFQDDVYGYDAKQARLAAR